MKKILLSAAALLIGAVSFAQIAGAPTSGMDEAIAGTTATTNTGYSIQNGNTNKAQVRQAVTNEDFSTDAINCDFDVLMPPLVMPDVPVLQIEDNCPYCSIK